ncbi:hypothetical protein Vafri_18905 [Volvox africanus]|uniref:Uncharacterized protein n=1 Tax=Volvox africanus TaxID=51714 RepID=A0A8J4BM16_9CHLO|nr:hypothetical protein Vafri_18905 [Volvox africanus]
MGTPPPLPEPVRGLRLEERAPSITTLIVEAAKTMSSSCVGPVCASDQLSAMPADVAGLQPARFAGFPADAPSVPGRPHVSPFAVAAGDDELSCGTGGSPSSIVDDAEFQLICQQTESVRLSIHPISPFESGLAPGLIGTAFGSASAQGVIEAKGKSCLKQHSESGADFNSRNPQEPIAPPHWSPSSFQGHWERSDSTTGPRISDPSALALPLSAPSPFSDIPAVGGGSRRVLGDMALALPFPAAAEELSPRFRQRLQSLIPEVIRGLFPALLPKLMPAAINAALPAASSVLTSRMNNTNNKTALDSLSTVESLLPVVLEAALTPALATTLPKAVFATLNLLFSAACTDAASAYDTNEDERLPAAPPAPAAAASGGSATSISAPPSLCSEPAAAAAVVTAAATTANAAPAAAGERQQSMSLEQQSAAEAQLVRMLFGVDGNESSQQQQHQDAAKIKSKLAKAATPCVLDVASAIASSTGSHGSGAASRVVSPTGSGISSPAEQLGSRPPSSAKSTAEGVTTAASQDNLEHAAVAPLAAAAAPVSAVRRPSLAAFAGASTGAAAPLSATGGDSYSRRLSETNHGSSVAPAAASRPASYFSAMSAKDPGRGSNTVGLNQPQLMYSRSSGGSGGGGSMGHGEDGMSSVEDALSTCSGGDMPSPCTEICGGLGGALGTGGTVNSSAISSFLMHSGNSADGAAAAGLYGIRGDTLLDRLQQVHQSQHSAAPASAVSVPGHIASPAELLVAASRNGGAGAAGGVLASQLVQQAQPSQAAVAAALFMQQQQQQRQQQQEAEAAVAAQQQLHQLQQLQALVVGRSLSEQDFVPPSPPLSSTAAAGGVQWRRSSGTDVAFSSDLWQTDADALGFAAAAQLALGQQQQQQQQQAIAAAGLLQQQQQQQQQQLIAQSLAAVAAANAAGRAVRAEDFLTFGTNVSGTGLQMQAASGLGSQAAAAQLAAAAAATATASNTAPSATDLASYMDTAIRRMLLVSPQAASELARACGAFSGAHAQLNHLCCIIAEQLLDVAAMAPEVAAALLRALAVHRTRGAQATDVDPRVMGRILQLLRAGPAGRQLCLVSLEQWVDGLSRIHKRRAYLDTILHNYQLTLKRLVQAMGHQVHAVNMSLPRQLLNDLSPRALLLLTAELAPYPLLQPRRWSEEIIWTVTQMHAMGIDMPAGVSHGGATAVAGQGSTPTSVFQWEVRRALAATADDIAAAGGAASTCGQSPPGAGGAGPLAGMGLGAGNVAAAAAGQVTGSSGATTPGGAAVPWAAHAALHRHLLLGLRRVQSRFFSDRLRKMHGLYGDAVEALLRSSLPQDVLVPEREVVVLVAVLLMLECRMRPEDFDAAFGRDLQRCLAVSSVEEVANRLRCGLVPDSPLRVDPHKSRALSQLLKLGALPGQPQF